ncbi:hypothetical protein DFJ74DRAFT_679252 [Hyaloraphidium curvatum]|nr:hypothetical protein DFJ74DRAFT_679252 [Hyaloraphidium curvatum]
MDLNLHSFCRSAGQLRPSPKHGVRTSMLGRSTMAIVSQNAVTDMLYLFRGPWWPQLLTFGLSSRFRSNSRNSSRLRAPRQKRVPLQQTALCCGHPALVTESALHFPRHAASCVTHFATRLEPVPVCAVTCIRPGQGLPMLDSAVPLCGRSTSMEGMMAGVMIRRGKLKLWFRNPSYRPIYASCLVLHASFDCVVGTWLMISSRSMRLEANSGACQDSGNVAWIIMTHKNGLPLCNIHSINHNDELSIHVSDGFGYQRRFHGPTASLPPQHEQGDADCDLLPPAMAVSTSRFAVRDHPRPID